MRKFIESSLEGGDGKGNAESVGSFDAVFSFLPLFAGCHFYIRLQVVLEVDTNFADFYRVGQWVLHFEGKNKRLIPEGNPSVSFHQCLIGRGSNDEIASSKSKFFVFRRDSIEHLQHFHEVLLIHAFTGEFRLLKIDISNLLPSSTLIFSTIDLLIFKLDNDAAYFRNRNAFVVLPQQLARIKSFNFCDYFTVISGEFQEF